MNQILGFLLATTGFISPVFVLYAIHLFIRQKYLDLYWSVNLLSRPVIRLGHEVARSGSATVVVGNMMKPLGNGDQS